MMLPDFCLPKTNLVVFLQCLEESVSAWRIITSLYTYKHNFKLLHQWHQTSFRIYPHTHTHIVNLKLLNVISQTCPLHIWKYFIDRLTLHITNGILITNTHTKYYYSEEKVNALIHMISFNIFIEKL